TLRKIRKKSPYTEVIVLSSESGTNVANTIKQAGAYDFIYKDRSAIDKIIYLIKGFWPNKKLQNENIHLKHKSRSSKGSAIVMIMVVLALIALLIYLLT